MPVNHWTFLGLVGLVPAMAFAQSAQLPTQTAAIAPTSMAMPVDTSALGYYLGRHDTARIDAELRRLRSLYPNWQPPSDLSSLAVSPGAAVDKPLWDLFGADRLEELDAEIAKRKAANPAWSPPGDLATKLAAKRARQALLSASDRKDYPAVIELASKTQGVLTPDDLDVSWRLADAYALTGASDKALGIDTQILTTVKDPALRVATLRKAMASLNPADLDKLLATGRSMPGDHAEIDAIELDLVRQRVGRVLSGTAGETPAPQDLSVLEASARGATGGADAALLGWLYSKQQKWGTANDLFQRALAGGPAPAQARPQDAKVVEGAVLALKGIGRPADAETLAYQWRLADPALALLYIASVEADLTRPMPVAVDAQRLSRFADVVGAQQSGDGSQALGWYAYNIGQFRAAEAWFRKALAWQPRDSTSLGLALSLKQMGDKPALAAFVSGNAATFASLKDLNKGATVSLPSAPSGRRARSVQQRPTRVVEVARPLRKHVAVRPATQDRSSKPCPAGVERDRGNTLQMGWCLMSLNRPQEAAAAFAAARGDQRTRVDAAYGQALANLRTHRTGDAVAAAAAAELTPTRRTEIGLSALAQSAASAFDQGDYDTTLRALDRRRAYASEPRDLAMLRAWSDYHVGHKEEARRLFSDLDQQLTTTETRTGLGIAGALRSRE